jgi:hypothetical protein
MARLIRGFRESFGIGLLCALLKFNLALNPALSPLLSLVDDGGIRKNKLLQYCQCDAGTAAAASGEEQ